MTVTEPARRTSTASRRTGYIIAAAISAVLIYLIDVRPGWQALPFLTDAAGQVVGLLTASLALGIAANVVYLVADRPLVHAVGDVLTTAVGLAVVVLLLRVFPFDFTGSAAAWGTVARVVLWFLVVVTAIGLVAQVARLLRLTAGGVSGG